MSKQGDNPEYECQYGSRSAKHGETGYYSNKQKRGTP